MAFICKEKVLIRVRVQRTKETEIEFIPATRGRNLHKFLYREPKRQFESNEIFLRLCRKKFQFEVRKVSEIWLKLVQQRTTNSKGVRTRGPELDLMRQARLVDYYSGLEAKVRTDLSLKQTNFVKRNCSFFHPQLKTPTKENNYFYLVNLFYVTEIYSKRCFLKLIETLQSRSALKLYLR